MSNWGNKGIISIFLILILLVTISTGAFAVPVNGTEIGYDDGSRDGYTLLGGGSMGDYTRQTLISITPAHDGKLKTLVFLYKTENTSTKDVKLKFLDASKNSILENRITIPGNTSYSNYYINFSTPQEVSAETDYFVGLERVSGNQILIGADTSSPDSKSVSQKCIMGACMMPWYTTETSKDHMIRAYVNYYPTVANAAVNKTPTNDNPITITADCNDYESSSYIASADYRIDDGSWESMTASDGGFNSPNEQVTKDWDTTSFSEGTHTIDVRCMDAEGEYTQANSSTSVFLDYTNPDTDVSLSGTEGTNGWYISSVDVTLDASDPNYPTTGSGIDDTKYILSGATTQAETSGTSFTISEEGTTTIEYWSTDVAGNEEDHKTLSVSIDSVSPTIPIIDDFENEFLNATQETISWSAASDDTSGVQMYTLVRRINGYHFMDQVDTNAISYLDNRDFVTDSLIEYKLKATDYAGNQSDWSDIKGFTVDLNAPTAPVMHALAAYTGGSGDVSLSWDASTDLSGIDHYSIQEKWGYLTFPNTVNHSTVADETSYLDNSNNNATTHKYKARATDNSEPTPNMSSWSGTVSTFIDRVNPNIMAMTLPNVSPNGENDWYVSSTSVMLVATDILGSGVDYINYCVYQGASDCSSYTTVNANMTLVSLSEGENHVKYYAVDRAGNSSVEEVIDVKLDLSNPYDQTILLDGGNEYNTTRTVTAALNTGADDISGLDSCEIKWENSSGWEDIDLAISASHTYSDDGEKTVRYRCYDNAGRKTNPVVFDSIIVDATPPISYITTPTGINTILDGRVRVVGTAFDATSGVNRVEVSVLDNTLNVVDTGIATGTENWIYYWDARNSINGSNYTIKSVAVDNATNDEPDANVSIFKLDYSTPTIDNYYYTDSGIKYVLVSGYLDYQNVDYNVEIYNSTSLMGAPLYKFPVTTDDNGFFALTVDVSAWDGNILYLAKIVGSNKSVSPTQFDGLAIANLSERLIAAEIAINDLNAVTEEMQTEIDSLTQQIADINARLDSIDANIVQLWTEVDSIWSSIDSLDERITAIENDLLGFRDITVNTYVNSYYVPNVSVPITFALKPEISGQYRIQYRIINDEYAYNSGWMTLKGCSWFDANDKNYKRGNINLSLLGDNKVKLKAVSCSSSTNYLSYMFKIRNVDLKDLLTASTTIVSPLSNSDMTLSYPYGSIVDNVYWTQSGLVPLVAYVNTTTQPFSKYVKIRFEGATNNPSTQELQVVYNGSNWDINGKAFSFNTNWNGWNETNYTDNAYTTIELETYIVSTPATYADVNVGIDNTAPIISSINPDEGGIMNGVYTWFADISDDLSGIAQVDFFLVEKEGYEYCNTTEEETSCWTGSGDIVWSQYDVGFDLEENKWFYDLITLNFPDGDYNVGFGATDIAGNHSYMEVDPIIDNTKPVIHSITVVPDPMLRGKAATVTAIVTDNLTGVKEVTATLDGNTITLTKDGNKYTGTYYTTTTWDIEAYTVTIVAEDVAGNITTDDTSVSLFQMYYFNVSNQSREIEKDTSTVFTIDGNFRDDEGNVPTDMNEILITSNIVQANVVQFDENGFFRINTFKIAKGNYFIDLNYNTDDYNYTTRLTITVSNPSTGSGGRGGAPSPTCTFTYSDWSTCNNGTQSREVLSSLPNGCMKRIEPVLTQECTLTTNPDTTGPTIPEIVEDGTDEPTGEILPTEELTGENDQPASPATGLFGLGDVGGFPLAGLGLLALILLIGGLFIFFKGRK